MWCISAFTPENGPLRVIPGSHRIDQNPADALPLGCEMGPHPAEVKLVTPAGSVIFQQRRPVAFRQVQLQPGPAPSGQPRLSSAVTDRRMMRPRDGSQVVCQAMRSPPLGTRRPMTRADRVSGPSGPPRDGARRPVAERDAGYRARCQRVLAATTRLEPPSRSQVATSSRASAPGSERMGSSAVTASARRQQNAAPEAMGGRGSPARGRRAEDPHRRRVRMEIVIRQHASTLHGPLTHAGGFCFPGRR
jgi:hypothetical protein